MKKTYGYYVGPFHAMAGCSFAILLGLTSSAFSLNNIWTGIFLGLTSILVLIAFFLYGRKARAKSNKQYSFISREDGFELYLMQLVSCLIKVDIRTEKSELIYIQEALSKHFDSKKVNQLMNQLKVNLDKKIDHKGGCHYVAANFNLPSKVQLIHLLIGVVTADGFLSHKEYDLIKEMARRMRIPHSTFHSILSMFRFRREGEEQKKRQFKSRTKTSLNQAYSILGVKPSVSDKMVKKAYRKLAILHHPDKVIHLGEDLQKASKEKFQIIQEAYEIIKNSRGMT
ncbi:MAG: DnaJ domain-containing protein [Flavobacteriales bacterium]|nr:DnaJ domain-containing protein [Flavobacteriales bacterium]